MIGWYGDADGNVLRRVERELYDIKWTALCGELIDERNAKILLDHSEGRVVFQRGQGDISVDVVVTQHVVDIIILTEGVQN